MLSLPVQLSLSFALGVVVGYLYSEYVFMKIEEHNKAVKKFLKENEEVLRKKWENTDGPTFLED